MYFRSICKSFIKEGECFIRDSNTGKLLKALLASEIISNEHKTERPHISSQFLFSFVSLSDVHVSQSVL